MNMNGLLSVPAPVQAAVAGPGSFFGSCQLAAGNFEAVLQSAAACAGAAAPQVSDACAPEGFDAPAEFSLRSFSEFLEGQGKGEVLAQLQEVLGDDAGAEAFEDAMRLLERNKASLQSPDGEIDEPELLEAMLAIASLQRSLGAEYVSAVPIENRKARLENCIENIKELLANGDFKAAEAEAAIAQSVAAQGSEMPEASLRLGAEERAYIERLASEIGCLPEDYEKFNEEIGKLFEAGLVSLQDLKEAAIVPPDVQMLDSGDAAVSQPLPEKEAKAEAEPAEASPIREVLESLWEMIKGEEEIEITNLFSKFKQIAEEKNFGNEKAEIPEEAPIKSNIGDLLDMDLNDFIGAMYLAIETGVPPEQRAEFVSLAKDLNNAIDAGLLAEKPVLAKDVLEKVLSDAKSPAIMEAASELESADAGDAETPGYELKEDARQGSDIANNLFALFKKAKNGEALAPEEKAELNAFISERINLKKQKLVMADASDAKAESKFARAEGAAKERPEPQRNEFGFARIISEPEEKTIRSVHSMNMGAKQPLQMQQQPPQQMQQAMQIPQAQPQQQAMQPQQAQQMPQAQPQQQAMQMPQAQQPQQAQQARRAEQPQPEVRAVWESGELKIETFNPKTGEKIQSLPGKMPSNMQERILEFEVVKQVVAHARFISTPTGEQRMTLQLRPEHLGQVDLKIALSNGEMQIHARVESPAAQAALETHIGLLREGLEKQGISLERLEVSVEQRDKQDAWSLAEKQEREEQRQHERRKHRRGREQHLELSAPKDESSDTGRRLGYNTMEYLA